MWTYFDDDSRSFSCGMEDEPVVNSFEDEDCGRDADRVTDEESMMFSVRVWPGGRLLASYMPFGCVGSPVFASLSCSLFFLRLLFRE